MDTERFEAAARIFLEVIDLEPAERERALISACGDNAELRGEVELLLAGDAEPVDLGRPSVGRHAAQLATSFDAEQVEVPGYRLGRVLGKGGMGIVFEAHQEHPARRVALKLIPSSALSNEGLQRFAHEVAVLARIDHPGVARILDAGRTADGRPYFTMELVDGTSLTTYGKSLVLEQRLMLIAEVCDAVEHAHRLGIVHRDLKPANVLVQPNGRPRILDFGIARAIGEDSVGATMLTATGQLVGTLAYMSPEQAAGERVDGRSDVYSLGVMLYELIVGRLPYEIQGKPIHEAVRIVCEEEPTALRGGDTRIARDLGTIIQKAMDKDRVRRYGRAADLAADLHRFLAHEPILARPVSRAYKLLKFARRNRAVMAGLIVAFVSMGAAMLVSMAKTAEAVEARNATQRHLVQARRQTYRASLALAQALISSGESRRANELLRAVPEGERGWEFQRLEAALDQANLLLSFPGEWLLDVALTLDGRVVIVTRSGRLRIHDAGTGDLLAEHSLGSEEIVHAALTRSGDRLVALAGDHVRLWDVESGRVIDEAACEYNGKSKVRWYRGGVTVTAYDEDAVWHWVPGNPATSFAGHYSEKPVAHSAHALPDGTWLIAGGSVHVCRPGHGMPPDRVFHTEEFGLLDIAVSPDGLLAVGGGSQEVLQVMDLRSGEEIRRTGPSEMITTVDLAPNNESAAAGSGWLVHVWNLKDDAPAEVLLGHKARVMGVRFAPGGDALVSFDEAGNVRCWERGAGPSRTLLAGHTSFVYDLAYLPDGERLVSVEWGGRLRLWSTSDGVPIGVLADQLRVPSTSVALAPRGGAVYVTNRHALTLVDLNGAAPPRLIRGPPTAELKYFGGMNLDISTDGSRLVLTRAWLGELVELETRRRVVGLSSKEYGDRPAAFSPDGTLLATASSGPDGNTIDLYDAESGVLLARHDSNWAHALAFSPAGNVLAVADREGELSLLDPFTGLGRRGLRAHTGRAWALTYSPDGTRLATGGHDKTIQVWDPQTGDRLLGWTAHRSYVKALAFSPDGTQLASASGDGDVALWDVRPRHEVRTARERMRRYRSEARAEVEALFEELGDAGQVTERLGREVGRGREEREARSQVAVQVALERGQSVKPLHQPPP